MTALNQLTRYQHWQVKLADLSLFVGFALAVQLPTSSALPHGLLCLSACAALAVFGYAWNDVCDAGPDSQAGKDRPARSRSRAVALLGARRRGRLLRGRCTPRHRAARARARGRVAGVGVFGAAARLKERGGLGLLAGAVAQRTLPAVFIAVAFDLSVLQTVPWLVWMTCWGLRGMVIHQAQDAEHDRLSGLATWGARAAPREAERLIAVLVPMEATALVVALLPLLAHTSVRIGSVTLLAAWSSVRGDRALATPRTLASGRLALVPVHAARGAFRRSSLPESSHSRSSLQAARRRSRGSCSTRLCARRRCGGRGGDSPVLRLLARPAG